MIIFKLMIVSTKIQIPGKFLANPPRVIGAKTYLARKPAVYGCSGVPESESLKVVGCQALRIDLPTPHVRP